MSIILYIQFFLRRRSNTL